MISRLLRTTKRSSGRKKERNNKYNENADKGKGKGKRRRSGVSSASRTAALLARTGWRWRE